ncbi:MAG: PhoX family protein [Gammaproteobacteria bacterium]|nr:PhoX family protein [Gammaproteobacteria bacterium]MBU2479108.1 PhoX family protein [Gammaproteobacteria bacterium]
MNARTQFATHTLSLALISAMSIPAPVHADNDRDEHGDFGAKVEHLLNSQSERLFGFNRPLVESAPATTGAYRSAGQSANDQILLAKGLRARYLTREAGNHTDMMALYPVANPTHLISCVEGGREVIGTLADGSEKYNPSVQRIELATGKVETILRGMDRCDGISATDWGTILATEETDDGIAVEIMNPLSVTEQTVLDRGAPGMPADMTDPDNIVKRYNMPTMAWEGLTVLPTGVVIGGDEERPGSGGPDADGGAIFKFVPTVPRLDDSMITDLAQSPLIMGNSYAMQVSCVNNKQQVGQGCEIGNAAWVQVDAANARVDADAKLATGFYRPEDLHSDPLYTGPGVRFCWANTGNEGAKNYAEVVCGIDSDPLVAEANLRSVEINRFVEGDLDFNSFDNLAFQPGTGNLYVIEDHNNGDVFACLQDGADRDIKSDGCVKMLSVKDTSAEPTGFMFSNDGRTAYVTIQHSDDSNMPMVDDYATDDLIMITGFKVKSGK